jgi:hypothetical protein
MRTRRRTTASFNNRRWSHEDDHELIALVSTSSPPIDWLPISAYFPSKKQVADASVDAAGGLTSDAAAPEVRKPMDEDQWPHSSPITECNCTSADGTRDLWRIVKRADES